MSEYFASGSVTTEPATTLTDLLRAIGAPGDLEWVVDPGIECAGEPTSAAALVDAAERGRPVTTSHLVDYSDAGIQLIEGWLRRADELLPALAIVAVDGSWWDLRGSDREEIERARVALAWPERPPPE